MIIIKNWATLGLFRPPNEFVGLISSPFLLVLKI
jgi:hypothetical protein